MTLCRASLLALLLPLFALADSLTPSPFQKTLALGETASFSRSITISQQLTNNLDVLFLVDTTGSMGPAITNVRAGFGSIVSSVSGVAPNTAFGVAQYRDVFNEQPFTLSADITANRTLVQAALNGLVAGGGGDTPEAGLYGLSQAAQTASWRDSSQRFVVWVGDAPSHDPAGPANVTESQAISALQSAGVTTLSASATTGPGLNAACGAVTNSCTAGQATRITGATGGRDLGTFDPNLLTTAITNSIVTTISNYNSISLAASDPGSGLGVTISPAITGSFDRSADRTFDFTTTFTGNAEGMYNVTFLGLVDGRIVALSNDTVTVGTPEPATYAISAAGLLLLFLLRRRPRTSN